MAKQAHQADLQADVVAKNIAARLRGEPGEHGFKTELVCIVDALDSGMLVYRAGREKGVMLPGGWLFHGQNPVNPLPTRQLNRIFDVAKAAAEIRSEERRVGKAGVRTVRSRWSAYHLKKKIEKKEH